MSITYFHFVNGADSTAANVAINAVGMQPGDKITGAVVVSSTGSTPVGTDVTGSFAGYEVQHAPTTLGVPIPALSGLDLYIVQTAGINLAGAVIMLLVMSAA